MSYVGAPYNFVSFSKDIYEYPLDRLIGHNELKEEGKTGEIIYEITAQTPIIVDGGKKKDNRPIGEFHKNAWGKYSIPGSSLRGLIRSNVQILGLSGVNNDIDDYALMYRNVASGVDKVRYNEILGSKQLRINQGKKSYAVGVLLNVHAGYVKNENGKYIIYQTCIESIKREFEGMNYYVLSERKIVNDYLESQKKETAFGYDFFLQNGRSILQHEFCPFKREVIKGRVQYYGKVNKDYKPYYREISYEIANEKDVTKVGKPGRYRNKGYAVSTGAMKGKKVVYIIPEIDRNKETIIITDKDVTAFKIDLRSVRIL